MRLTAPARLLSSLLLAVGCGATIVACGGGGGGGGPIGTTSAAVTSSGSVSTSTSGTTGGGSTTAPTATQTVLASGTLRALTYNVAGLPQGISGSNPVRNTPQISPKLNAYDLVVVQEDFWYHAQLERDAQHPFRSAPLTTHTTLVNDGLNTFSHTPFSDFTRVRWNVYFGLFTNSNDGLASKGWSAARHELFPGITVDVYDLHADAGGDQGDIDARVQQFAQLAQFMATYSAGRAVLVGGDTNLRDTRARDMQTLADFLGATGLTDSARTLGGPETIDRWMFRSSAELTLTPVRWRYADEMVDAAGGPLSDHEGVNVDFEWKWIR